MIRLICVSKYFVTRHGRHYVLRDADLVIPDGVNVGVLGRNGSGKSTLMRLIAGVDIPNKGTVERHGRYSWPMGIAQGLQGAMTGRENARFVCRIQGLGRDAIPEIIDFIAGFAEIGAYFDMPVSTYSSGMRARLNFAISMAIDFDCYIIDELTAVGDLSFAEKSRRVFKEKRDRASFIKVSHNLRELGRDCDAGLVLDRATIRYFPEIDAAIDAYRALVAR